MKNRNKNRKTKRNQWIVAICVFTVGALIYSVGSLTGHGADLSKTAADILKKGSKAVFQTASDALWRRSGTKTEAQQEDVSAAEQTEELQESMEQEETLAADTNASETGSSAEDTAAVEAAAMEQNYQNILHLSAGEIAAEGLLEGELADRLFFSMEIDEALLARIDGKSYTPNEHIQLKELSYLRMLCYGMDGNTYVGEMIVNQQIKAEILAIFQELYENQYPVERMTLVDNYNADDEASMQDNNTSAFNYRTISGSNKLSNHSYGMAVDLNPKYNPYVKTASDGSTICQPADSLEYADRSKEFAYKIDENDLAYRLFTQAGFTWGGSWNSVKDYQHFEKE